MLVEFIAKIVADIGVYPEDEINYDTIADYTEEVNAAISNSALDSLSVIGLDNMEILSARPVDEGMDEYKELLNNYQQEYNKQTENFNKRMKKYERKRT